uniref:Uncharacterized protein n=1 Tax=Anguilla anguilla TaxID=7936 RepID=A0A0E9TJ73_ANGAN
MSLLMSVIQSPLGREKKSNIANETLSLPLQVNIVLFVIKIQ